MATATYVPIATQTLSTAASSITFSSIPSTYTDLRLVLKLNVYSGGATNVRMQYNGDTGANYSFTYLAGNGSSAFSTSVTGSTSLRFDSGNTAASQSVFAGLDIFSYAGSTYKTCLQQYSADNNGSGFLTDTVGLWRSTVAINSISIYGNAGSFDVGTTATLWGI